MRVSSTTDTAAGPDPAATVRRQPTVPVDVDVVVPVYNEAGRLASSVTALRRYLDTSFPLTATVTIADNASTDGTWAIARRLAEELPRVRAVHLDEKGRGRALRSAWSQSSALVVAYMDVDLSTGLDALLPLVAPLLSGHSDLAIGTRLAPGAHVVRGARRELISRAYNLILRSTLRSCCSDAQCGFKAMRTEVAQLVLPLVEDEEWFFDTEILVTAQRLGLRIHEVPVDWVDDNDSRVDVLRTAVADLRGVWRMLGRPIRRFDRHVPALATPGAPGAPGVAVFADELLRFAGVGVVSTLAFAVLFLALEPVLGGFAASAVAIVVCSLGNTAVHRGLARRARGGLDATGRVGIGAGLLGVSLIAAAAALAAIRAVGLHGLLPELVAVTSASVLAAGVRFAILRTWVFRPQLDLDRRPSMGSLPSAGTTGERTTP
jgi:Glycosyl transferase family 2